MTAVGLKRRATRWRESPAPQIAPRLLVSLQIVAVHWTCVLMKSESNNKVEDFYWDIQIFNLRTDKIVSSLDDISFPSGVAFSETMEV